MIFEQPAASPGAVKPPVHETARVVRRQSKAMIAGLPLYDVAFGAVPERGERRGHARGIVAIGDVATGLLAIGGIARGGIALGGVALGGVAIGGCSVGLLAALGGLAVGSLAIGGAAIGGVAVGGATIGFVSIGGAAIGYYAAGGAALGKHMFSASCQDPEAVQLFSRLLPGLQRLAGPPPG